MEPFTLDTAIQIALNIHRNQKDMGGQPYILHPLRVMQQMKSMPTMMVAVLHDAVEDSDGDLTFEILRGFGCPEMVIEGIDSVTKRKDEPYEKMIQRAKANEFGREVKIADLEDNMDIRRILGRKEGMINDKDKERLAKYLRSWTELTGK